MEDQKTEAENVIMLATESKRMLENIESVISETVASAEYTLGHTKPLSPQDFGDIEMEDISIQIDHKMTEND